MFTNLKIENYRGIQELEIDDLKRVNLIVGRNNCGKTAILEALFILCGSNNLGLPLSTNSFRGFNIVNENVIKGFFHNFETDNNINIDGKLSSKPARRKLTISPHFSSSNLTSNKKEKLVSEDYAIQESSTQVEPLINGLNYHLELGAGKAKEKHDGHIYFVSSEKENPVRTSNIESQIGINAAFFNSITYQYPKDLTKRFERIVVKKEVGKIVKILQKIEPNIEDVRVINNIIYCDIGLNELLPLNSLGDGIFRLFAIIIAFTETIDGVLFVDEIDTGMHYSSLDVMWATILESAKQYNTQVFTTTHSEDCVKSFSKINLDKLFNELDVGLFRIEKSNGKLISKKYELRTLRASIEKNWEVR